MCVWWWFAKLLFTDWQLIGDGGVVGDGNAAIDDGNGIGVGDDVGVGEDFVVGDVGDEEEVFSPVDWLMGVSDTGDGHLPLSHTTPNLLQNRTLF